MPEFVVKDVEPAVWLSELGALHERIKTVERQLLVDTVAELATADATRRGRVPR